MSANFSAENESMWLEAYRTQALKLSDKKNYKKSDETLQNFLKDVSQTDELLEAFKEYPDVIYKTGKAFDFAALGAKAFNAALNIGIMFAIAKGLELVITLINNYIHRVEIAKETLNESVSNYESVKSELEGINSELKTQNDRMDELLAKDKLTFAEKNELENLRKITTELRIQAAIKQKESEASALDVAENAVDAYRKEYNNGISEERISDYINNATINGNVVDPAFLAAVDGQAKDLSALIAAYEILKQKKEETSVTDGGMYEYYSKKVTKLGELLTEQLSNLENYKNKFDAIPENIASQKLKNSRAEAEDSIKAIWAVLDPKGWNTIQIDDIFNAQGIEKTKEELIQLAKNGKLDENMIQSYSTLYEAIKSSNLIFKDGETAVSAFKNEIEALSSSAEGTSGDFSNTFTSLTKDQVISNINSLSEGFESLDKIMSSIKDKDNPFDYALLGDRKFKENFSSLGVASTDFIKKNFDSPKDTEASQSAFNSLIAEWIKSKHTFRVLTDDTAKLTAAMLKNTGVANAEEVVYGELNAKKIEAKLVTIDFSKSIEEQINTMRFEMETYGLTVTELDNLTISYANAQNSLTTALSYGFVGRMNILESELQAIRGVGDAYNLIGKKIDESASKTGDTSAEAQRNLNTNMKLSPELNNQVQSVINYGNEMDKIQATIDKAKNAKGTIAYAGGTKGNNPSSLGNSGKENGNNIKEFDFVERRLKLLEDKRAELKEKSNNTYIDFLGITQSDFDRAKELLTSDISKMTTGADELFAIAQRTGLTMAELHTLVSTGNPSESKENYLSQINEII